MSSSGMGRDVHSLMLSIQHFLCRPRRRLPSKVAPRNGFGEAVVARAMSEPGKFLSLDSCQKRFLWTHREVDLVAHPVVCLAVRWRNPTRCDTHQRVAPKTPGEGDFFLGYPTS